MAQETIRFSESIVDEVEDLVENGEFEHKSEFYRFATEVLLNALNEEYDPEMVKYDRLLESVTNRSEGPGLDPGVQHDDDAGSTFYRSATTIRRHARRGESEAAEEHIDARYPPERGEYLLLEDLLDYYTTDA
ncbi:transcriptional regulator [Natronococcus sp. JC468]|uniref:transcriptional regulator n=1 Tax=Natronococcus sp. JC468 TaxID=1961921 RepID=UPI00143BBC8A|nr:transcriptional regulator [Natronococcus sp. JC468]NKE36559.1 transcriptional regulator [Natronococcus sp. JC468]